MLDKPKNSLIPENVTNNISYKIEKIITTKTTNFTPTYV